MPISPDEFRAALSRFASGVTVVTTKDAAGKIYGITVSAFCSVSLEPPLVLICIEKVTGSHQALSESGIFVVNFLDQSQVGLSEKFASPTAEKFEDVDVTINIDGIPVLSGSLANLECRVWQSYEGGDHTIFVGEVENVTVGEGDPLLYFRSDYRKIGS